MRNPLIVIVVVAVLALIAAERVVGSSRGIAPQDPGGLVLRKREPDRRALAVVAELSERERYRVHLFWSPQQVADRFGPPTHVFVTENGLPAWRYRYAAQRSVTFWFVDGYVFRVSAR